MKNRKLYFFTSLGITLISLALLLSGSSLLTLGLDTADTIPLGTFTTWAGLMALPATLYFWVKELRDPSGKWYAFLSGVLRLSLLLAILWAPVSYLLAGNMSFSFSSAVEGFRGSPQAYVWFMRFTNGIVYGALLVLSLYCVTLLWERLTKKIKR
ncbi:hypothetical protein [Robertkochia sediminum]|uniref:hypothetical protein n=1 Tax=Robertkochia sediminum TaxID=2785326 RepID=UPI001932235B|nr:hypothetical protein [Robertkochia sediminum]MBL7472924.1 hypothetical protein [Robertkochia sediminum]